MDASTLQVPSRIKVLLSLLLVFGGGMVYWVLLTVPWVRSTGVPAFLLMGTGLLVGVPTWRKDRRFLSRLVVGLDVALVAIFFGYFFVFARLPAVGAVKLGDLAPQFVATDHNGRQVALADALQKGPVLLVFYRGHW
ncbi:MAG: hypothetical protein ACE5GE_00290 [Phycisphaerae bacterium]